jgi:hypothetical protein
MFLRRKMRKWYEQGRMDAIEMGTRNPFIFSDEVLRWAYDAGFNASMTKQRMARPTVSLAGSGPPKPPPMSKA